MGFGTLAFDTLQTSDSKNTGTNKTLDTSFVFNGSAKVFHSVDQTGDTATLDSFNISGVTDHGTGSTTSSFSNNMNNVNYIYNLTRDRTGAQNGGVVQQSSVTTPQTTGLRSVVLMKHLAVKT